MANGPHQEHISEFTERQAFSVVIKLQVDMDSGVIDSEHTAAAAARTKTNEECIVVG